MSDDNSQQQSGQQHFQVSFDDDVSKIGMYSNVASVHVNNNEVIMDFGYIMPNSKPAQILIGSRVNMSHETAKSFISMLQNAILDFQNKSKGQK